jgi:uncharacterized membrane protein YqjE
MIHPLLKLVATQPQLLADHAEAYAGLVGEEIGKTASAWKTRALMGAIALVLLCVALVLAGVALMLWAVTPDARILAPWAFFAAPGIPALVGVACLIASRRAPEPGFSDLKQQLAADLAMLREVNAS